jgi:hypothetical protein
MPSMDYQVNNEQNTTVYGGEVPTFNFSVNEEKPVTIYGGNDPLEATQTLPKVEEHHEPYGGVYPEAKIVDSMQEIEVPKPIEEVVSTIPITEENTEIPVVEPTVSTLNNNVEPSINTEESLPNNDDTIVVNEPTPIIIPDDEQESNIEEL